MSCGFKVFGFANKWGIKTEFWEAETIQQWIDIYVNQPFFDMKEGMRKDLCTMVMCCLFYAICNFRNKNLFHGKKNLWKVVKSFKMLVDDFISMQNEGRIELGVSSGKKKA